MCSRIECEDRSRMIRTTSVRSSHRFAFGKAGRGLRVLCSINSQPYIPQQLIPSSYVQHIQESGTRRWSTAFYHLATRAKVCRHTNFLALSIRLGFVASNRRYSIEIQPTMPGSFWNKFETPHPRRQLRRSLALGVTLGSIRSPLLWRGPRRCVPVLGPQPIRH